MSSTRSLKHFVLSVGPGILRIHPAIEVVPNQIYEVTNQAPEYKTKTLNQVTSLPVMFNKEVQFKKSPFIEEIRSLAVSLK